MPKGNDEFKGLKISKDLKDFHYHVSLTLKGDEFLRQFENEFWDFVKRKSETDIQKMSERIGRIK